MYITRRHLLSGTCAFFASRAVPALAQDPATIANAASAAASLVSNVLDYLKQGGAFENRLEELNVKLDQLLRNQLLLVEAIGDLAKDVQLVSKAVGQVPAETLAMFLLNKSASLSTQLADAINRGGDVARYIEGAYILSTEIRNGARLSDRPPNLALAARNILNVVQAIHQQQPHLPTEPRGSLADACTHVRDALERMTRDDGLQARIPDRKQIDQAIKALTLANTPLKLLPQNFASTQPLPSESETWTTSICLLSGDTERVLRHHRGFCRQNRLVTDAPPYCTPDRSTINVQTLVIKPKLTIQRRTAYGGRSLYEVKVHSTDDWERSTWNKQIVRTDGEHDDYVLPSSDDPKLLSNFGCRSVPTDEDGLPRGEFSSLKSWLGIYDSYVAIESRLLAMQSAAIADIDRCKRITEQL